MIKIRIKRADLRKLTAGVLAARIAVEQEEVGPKAARAVEDRVTGPGLDASGRRIAPKRVKAYEPRTPWEPKKRREESTPRARNPVPFVIFQQMRELGGVFRSAGQYAAQKLKGGEPITADAKQTWNGRVWNKGDVWGYRWADADAFHAAQGDSDKLDLGGRGSRVWRKLKMKPSLRKGGVLRLTLGWTGAATMRRRNMDATHVYRDVSEGALAKRGDQWERKPPRKRPTPAQIAAMANSRDSRGYIGDPDQDKGRPIGGKAELSGRLSDRRAVRWLRLTDAETRRIILPAIARGFSAALREAPRKIVLVEPKRRPK